MSWCSVYLGACIRSEILEAIELKRLVLCVFVEQLFCNWWCVFVVGGRGELVQIVEKSFHFRAKNVLNGTENEMLMDDFRLSYNCKYS